MLAARENGLKTTQITTDINTFANADVAQMKTFAGGNGQATFPQATVNTSGVFKDTILNAAGAL